MNHLNMFLYALFISSSSYFGLLPTINSDSNVSLDDFIDSLIVAQNNAEHVINLKLHKQFMFV